MAGKDAVARDCQYSEIGIEKGVLSIGPDSLHRSIRMLEIHPDLGLRGGNTRSTVTLNITILKYLARLVMAELLCVL